MTGGIAPGAEAGGVLLHSPHFSFRPLVASDAPVMADAVRESASTVGLWLPWAHEHYAIADASTWIERCQHGWRERSSFEFGIFERASGRYIGGCGLNQLNYPNGFCNLGYWVRQSARRQGAATEAIGALSDFAFAALPFARIEIVVGVGNTASLGAARKAGAVEEGIARRRLKLGQRQIDAHMLSIVAPTSSPDAARGLAAP